MTSRNTQLQLAQLGRGKRLQHANGNENVNYVHANYKQDLYWATFVGAKLQNNLILLIGASKCFYELVCVVRDFVTV